eukprot:586574-Amphidinium_carterae.1
MIHVWLYNRLLLAKRSCHQKKGSILNKLAVADLENADGRLCPDVVIFSSKDVRFLNFEHNVEVTGLSVPDALVAWHGTKTGSADAELR